MNNVTCGLYASETGQWVYLLAHRGAAIDIVIRNGNGFFLLRAAMLALQVLY